MSKELEALEDIILYLNANEPKGLYCKNVEIIKTALKDFEWLKSKLTIDFYNKLPEPKDKIKFLKILYIKENYKC